MSAKLVVLKFKQISRLRAVLSLFLNFDTIQASLFLKSWFLLKKYNPLHLRLVTEWLSEGPAVGTNGGWSLGMNLVEI